jgi:hypothetical protein
MSAFRATSAPGEIIPGIGFAVTLGDRFSQDLGEAPTPLHSGEQESERPETQPSMRTIESPVSTSLASVSITGSPAPTVAS